MTQQRSEDMQQMLEAWRATDANDADAEKTSVVAELLALVTSTADYGASNATSAD